MLLATVCREWRHAAALAVQALELRLQPSSDALPVTLSPLLGELVEGCLSMSLWDDLLVAHTLPSFLERARPAVLTALPRKSASAAVGAVLAGCTSLRALDMNGGVLRLWAPNLTSLRLSTSSCTANKEASNLLHSLQALTCLETLHLRNVRVGAVLLDEADLFQPLAALRELHVELPDIPRAKAFGLSSLSAAAQRGVQVLLRVRMCQDSNHTTLDRFWTALSHCHALSHLRILLLRTFESKQAMPAVEQQLLAALCCTQLVLNIRTGTQPGPLQLLSVRCAHLVCSICAREGADEVLDWSCLAAQPGIYMLSHITVTGCTGSLPGFAESWAVVSQDPAASGLPVQKFSSGPRGRLVWRNGATSDAALEKAYATVGLWW